MGKRRKVETLVEAKQVNLLDEDGRVRATLCGGGKTHGPNISFCDGDGRQRLMISLDPEGFPVVCLLNDNGSTGVGFGINAEGRGITITMRDGRLGIIIGTDPDEEPYLEAFDVEGKSKWRAP